MGRRRKSSTTRRQRFEQFEQRLLMSADGIGFSPVDVDAFVSEIAPLVSSAATNASTQTSVASNSFGYDGSGQTIAVIDSGIAYDHAAFGGGFGGSNKVVGGFDFAENDADPYDDGPAGFHGTHVAGIAAGNGAGYQGVAPGADLVGLRVFNDQGVGKIEWVESALQWVHDNLDSFRNPITTVNLSLGADATETSEDWAVIIDELYDLEQAGVFISVAAGNSFGDLQTKQLSHPADSEFVVPVASHDSNNQLSDFSQRDDHVLVAPGESIRSAVPDHLFGNRRTDQFLNVSGTSQATPYVAGASAVLRQAYGALGYGEVDQDTLYQTFWDSANQIYDSVTDTTYRQLDLDAAIQSITESANQNVTQVGTLTGGETIRGTISGGNDVERYQFTAAATGQVELTFEATELMDPTLEVTDSAGQEVELQFDGERVYIDVLGDESYQLSVGSQSGSGHYQISTAFQSTSAAMNLGVVDSLEVVDNLQGQRTYSLTASHSGPATFGFATDSGDGTIEVFDANMNRLTSQSVDDGRVDFQFDVSAGEQLFVSLRAEGVVELTVDNLVSVEDGTVTVYGTEAADSFVINDANTLDVNVNGQQYSIDKTNITSVVIRADAAEDTLQLTLGERFERTVLRQNRVDAFDGSNTFRAIGFSEIDVHGQGTLTVAGSEQNDSIVASFDSASIGSATGFGYTTVIADGNGGDDSIEFTGSDADEILFSRNNYSAIRNDSGRLIAIEYEQLSIDGGGGHDITNLFGTEGADQFELGADSLHVSDGAVDLDLTNFERVTAFAGSEADAIVFTDSEGNDRFLFSDGTSQLVSLNTHIVAHRFNDVTVNSTQGNDVAQIQGSGGDDTLDAGRDQSTLVVDDATVEINGFDRINVVANFAGADSVSFTGTNGDDRLVVDNLSATTTFAGGSIVRAVGFGEVAFDGLAGNDLATLNGSSHNDILTSGNSGTTFLGENTRASLQGLETVRFDGDEGNDVVYLDDALSLDVVASIGERAVAVLERHRVEAENVERIEANAVDGVIATYDMERVDLQSTLRGNWQRRV